MQHLRMPMLRSYIHSNTKDMNKTNTMKNLEFSSKRVSYAHQIEKSGKRPTDEQVKQCYLRNIEDGRFLENVQKNWDRRK